VNASEDRYLDRDLANKAIDWMRMQHALAQQTLVAVLRHWHRACAASRAQIAKYKGQFDQGWDKVREETLAGRSSSVLFRQTPS
jgi:hypothetical protein